LCWDLRRVGNRQASMRHALVLVKRKGKKRIPKTMTRVAKREASDEEAAHDAIAIWLAG